ncbi:MAG: deoxynucleoside kinase, partial [Noviherbaspirillum sp.]
MSLDKYKYVVVEGPIGVGKTSLARKLADSLHAHPLLELPQENPFLEKFYRDAARYALPTQMFFLFQRMNQLRDLTQTDLFDTRVVSDFLLDKDPIFARLTLGDDELNLYQQLYDHLRPQAPLPDLVIY